MFNAIAEGGSEKFRVIYSERAYDVIILKFQEGGAFAVPAPLPSADASPGLTNRLDETIVSGPRGPLS